MYQTSHTLREFATRLQPVSPETGPGIRENAGDAVVTKTVPNSEKLRQTLHRANLSHHCVFIGDLRILPHMSKQCNLAPDPLSRR